MFWLAFILAVLAFVCFIIDAFDRTAARRVTLWLLGLAFLVAAWVVQVIVQTAGGRFTIR